MAVWMWSSIKMSLRLNKIRFGHRFTFVFFTAPDMLLAKMGRDTWFNARGGSISQSDANGGHSYVLVLSMAGMV